MPRRKRWEELGIRDGFGQIRFLRWRYFTDYINQQMLDYETYIWRGHRREDWSLKSTLDRLIEEANVSKTKQLLFRSVHLEQFKYAARGRRGPNPPLIETENEWWALGQHHGLATPLLDWTASPFVAAYFAMIKKGIGIGRYRAIYALHRPTIEQKVQELMRAKKEESERKKEEYDKSGQPKNRLAYVLLTSPDLSPEVEFIRPRSDDNQRLVSQGGLFTRSPIGMTLEEWVQKYFVGKTDGYTLMKLLVPNRDREEALRMLNRMNINHLTLFPDLYGASKYCNLFGEIDKY